MKTIKIFLFLFLCSISFYGNVFSQGNEIESIEKRKISTITENLYNNLNHRKLIDEYFETKEEFIEHFKENWNYSTDDHQGLSYIRKLAEENQKLKEKKEIEENGGIKKVENGKNDLDKLLNIKDFVSDGDDDWVFSMIFGTTDRSKLIRLGFLPEQGTEIYSFIVKLYSTLLIFFMIIGSLIIIYFIFFIISHYKGIFGGKKDSYKFGKFEEFIIAFLVVVIILFGGFRYYMFSLKSGMKAIETDIEKVKYENK